MKDFKVIILGESGVGKTSLLTRFTEDKFYEETTSSIIKEYNKKLMSIEDKTINFALWDTAGQEKFRTLVRSFYKDSSGVILVYDITKKNTFEELKNYWNKEIDEYCPNICKY